VKADSARFLPVFQAARPLLFTEKPLYSARTQGKEWKLLIEGVNPIGAAFVLTLLIDVLVAAAPLSAFAAAWIYTPRGQKRE
jgi:hypothetical protein